MAHDGLPRFCRAVGLNLPGGRGLQDRAARSYLDGGDAPAVEHDEPVAVLAAQCPAIFCQGRDDVFRDLVRGSVLVAVGDIYVVAASGAVSVPAACPGG